jgi:hypothetical protein
MLLLMLSSHAAITGHFCTKVFDTATGSEVIFATGARGRIINADETHHTYSNEGDCGGGSRGNGETNPQFGTGGERAVSNSMHTRDARHRGPRRGHPVLHLRHVGGGRGQQSVQPHVGGRRSGRAWQVRPPHGVGLQPDLASMSDADKHARCWHSFMLAWLATNLASLASLELPRMPTGVAGGDCSGLELRSWVSAVY